MGAVSTIISAIGALASVAGTAGGLFGGKPDAPKALPPPKPQGKATKPDVTDFSGMRSSGTLAPPKGISFSAGATPEQKRSQIATQGVAGSSGQEIDPSVQEYYRQLSLNTLTGAGGRATGTVLPVERQYLRDVVGQTPRNESTASFLSALLRA